MLLCVNGGFDSQSYFDAQDGGYASGNMAILPNPNAAPDLAVSLKYLGQGLQVLKNTGAGQFTDGGYYPSADAGDGTSSANYHDYRRF